jgi:formate dehydrogenase subunit gamma
MGFVPEAAVAPIAEALNLTRAEVHGTVSFYHDLRRAPAGRRIIKLCQAEACQARGGRSVAAAAEALLGIQLGETSSDGAVTLEPIYCLGLCASGPAALVDGRPVGRLTPEESRKLLEAVAG